MRTFAGMQSYPQVYPQVGMNHTRVIHTLWNHLWSDSAAPIRVIPGRTSQV